MDNLATPPFPLAGELAALTAALIWSCTMTIFRRFGTGIPAAAMNLYKNLVALVCLALAVIALRPIWPTDPKIFMLLAASGICGLSLGDTALFEALKRLGAQITSATQCLAPPISAGIATIALGEMLTGWEAAGMTLTTAAVFLIVHFGRRGGSPMATLPRRELLIGILCALGAALGQGLGVVLSRVAMQSIDATLGTLLRVAPAILVLGAMLRATGQPVSVAPVLASRRQTIFLTGAAFAGTFVGLVLLSISAKYTKAGIAASLSATYPVWIIPVSRLTIGERVSWKGSLCAVAAVAGIVLMVV